MSIALIVLTALAGLVASMTGLLLGLSLSKTQRRRLPFLQYVEKRKPHLVALATVSIVAMYVLGAANDLVSVPESDWQLAAKELEKRPSVRRLQVELRESDSRDAELASMYFVIAERQFLGGHYRDAADHFRDSALTVATSTAYLNLGIVRRYMGEFDASRDAFTSGLNIARKRNDKGDEATLLVHLCALERTAGDMAAAVTRCDEGFALIKGIDDAALRGYAFVTLGRLQWERGDANAAASSYEMAERSFKDGQDEFAQTVAKLWSGKVLEGRGRVEEARHRYEEALTAFRAQSHVLGEGAALAALGELSMSRGTPQQAIQELTAALELFRRTNAVFDTAAAVFNIGSLNERLGNRDKASEHFLESSRLFAEIGNRRRYAGSLHAVGRARAAAGHLEQARELYEQSRAIYAERGLANSEAGVLNDLGANAGRLGKIDEAREYFRRALNLYEKTGGRLNQGIAWLNIGKTYRDQGRLDEAIAAYRTALTLFSGSEAWRATVLDSLSTVLAEQGDLATAAKSADEAIAIFAGLGDGAKEATAHNDRGEVAFFAGQFDVAVRYYSASFEKNRALKRIPEQAISLNNLGRAHLQLRDFGRALKAHQEALSLAEGTERSVIRADALGGMGLVLVAQRQDEAAVRRLSEAVKLYEASGVVSPERRTFEQALKRLASRRR